MPNPDPYLEPVDEFPPYHVEVTAATNSYGGGFIPLQTADRLTPEGLEENAQKFDTVADALIFVGKVIEATDPREFYYRVVDADGDVAWSSQPKPAEPEPTPSYCGHAFRVARAQCKGDSACVDIRIPGGVALTTARNVHPDLADLEFVRPSIGFEPAAPHIQRLNKDEATELAEAILAAVEDAKIDR